MATEKCEEAINSEELPSKATIELAEEILIAWVGEGVTRYILNSPIGSGLVELLQRRIDEKAQRDLEIFYEVLGGEAEPASSYDAWTSEPIGPRVFLSHTREIGSRQSTWASWDRLT